MVKLSAEMRNNKSIEKGMITQNNKSIIILLMHFYFFDCV